MFHLFIRPGDLAKYADSHYLRWWRSFPSLPCFGPISVLLIDLIFPHYGVRLYSITKERMFPTFKCLVREMFVNKPYTISHFQTYKRIISTLRNIIMYRKNLRLIIYIQVKDLQQEWIYVQDNYRFWKCEVKGMTYLCLQLHSRLGSLVHHSAGQYASTGSYEIRP